VSPSSPNTSFAIIVSIIASIALSGHDAPAQEWLPPARIHIGGGHYPALTVNGDTMHCAYTRGPGRAKITYMRSLDAGFTWSADIVLNDTINFTNAYYPRFLINGPKMMALWYEASSVGQLGNLTYSVSTNRGNTWGSPQHALNPGLLDVYLFSAASVDSTANIIYSRLVWPQMGFFLTRSTDFGRTWSSPSRLFWAEETSFSDMEAWGDTFHFVWSGNFAEGVNWEVYYIRSVDRGANWTLPETLTAPGGMGARDPALSINENGRLTLAWIDFRYAPPGWVADIFFARSTDQGESWQDETQLTFLHQDAYPDIFYSADTIHIAFERHDAPIREIWQIGSTDDGATWGEETELDLDPADSHDPRVAYSNGRTYVIWPDDRDNPDTTVYGGLYFSYYPYEPDAVVEGENIPETFSLEAYPNPFNSSVAITYSSPKGGEIEIFDIKGQLLRTFFTGGENEGRIKWDATDASGKKVSSGIYFARAETSQSSQVVKLIYLK